MTDDVPSKELRVWNIAEDDQANSTDPVLTPKTTRKIRKGHVRFVLALGLLIVVGTMAITGAIHWAIGGTSDVQQLVVLMSPVTTLAGAVFAFYFTDSRKK